MMTQLSIAAGFIPRATAAGVSKALAKTIVTLPIDKRLELAQPLDLQPKITFHKFSLSLISSSFVPQNLSL